jgi:ribosomal protein S18 acetylase RimI-like enzyme
MEITYRKADISESYKIAELYNEFLCDLRDIGNDIYFDFEELSVDERVELLKERFNADKGLVVVAEVEGEIVGFISMTIINCFMIVSSIKDIGYIEAGYVKSGYRRLGINRQLEKMVEDFLKEKGIRYLELFTLMNNEIANNSWSKLGFIPFRQQWRKDLNE